MVVKDFAILTRADGQRVFDLAAAIMWAGQCDIAKMLREVHSHEAYASLVKTVARTEEGRYPRAMAPCASVGTASRRGAGIPEFAPSVTVSTMVLSEHGRQPLTAGEVRHLRLPALVQFQKGDKIVWIAIGVTPPEP